MATIAAWVVVCTALLATGRSGAPSRECTPDGCCYTPDRHNAEIMECDLRGEQIRISNEVLSPAIRTIQIRNAEQVTIAQNALAHKTFLENIGIADVRRLSLDREAFAGPRGRQFNMSITNVTDGLTIAESAFPTNSELQRLLMDNVLELEVLPAAFQGSIGEMVLTDVAMGEYGHRCSDGAFGGRIRSLSLSSVRLMHTSEGCIWADQGWQKLTVRDSILSFWETSTIRGMIGDVLIEGSRMYLNHPTGLNLTTSNFTIRDTFITGGLFRGALDVLADRSISLLNVSVHTLYSDTFGSLRVAAPSQGILVSLLSVESLAEAGSLTFADGAAVTLERVMLPIPCTCDIGATARRLVMSDETTSRRLDELSTNRTTVEQQALLGQVYRNTHCELNETEPSFAEFLCQQCQCPADMKLWRRSLEDVSGPSNEKENVATAPWIIYVSLTAVLLLL